MNIKNVDNQPKSNFEFEFSKSDVAKTGVELVSVLDKTSGVIVRTALAGSQKNTGGSFPATVAFTGARFSRSADTAEAILSEINTNQKDAGERLGAIFRGYGHASVADMANLFVFIENVPLYVANYFFYSTAIGGGQERSTRYQDFGKASVKSINQYIRPYFSKQEFKEFENTEDYQEIDYAFQNLQHFTLQKYAFWQDKLTTVFADSYKVDIKDAKQNNTLKARVFDTCRAFLLFGASSSTSLAHTASAREWARIIAQFKAESDLVLVALGHQIETLLAPNSDFDKIQAQKIDYQPEALELIKYTEADHTENKMMAKLEEFLTKSDFCNGAKYQFQPGRQELSAIYLNSSYKPIIKAFIQNILCLYPNLSYDWIASRIEEMGENWQKELSMILVPSFDHHRQMPSSFRTTGDSFWLVCSIAEGRDLLRHRAWGRFCPLLSCATNFEQANFQQVLDYGYVLPAYLTQNPAMEEILTQFELDIQSYYAKLNQFSELLKNWLSQRPQNSSAIYKSILVQLLPFCHNMPIAMHGTPKEISYFTKLRVRAGGHINYRLLAFEMAQNYGSVSPLNSGFVLPNKPDPSSSQEFLDRS